MDTRSSADHRSAILSRAQAFIDELRTAARAARERVFAGVPMPSPPAAPDAGEPATERIDGDPVFATREFDVPPQALGALIDFNLNED